MARKEDKEATRLIPLVVVAGFITIKLVDACFAPWYKRLWLKFLLCCFLIPCLHLLVYKEMIESWLEGYNLTQWLMDNIPMVAQIVCFFKGHTPKIINHGVYRYCLRCGHFEVLE